MADATQTFTVAKCCDDKDKKPEQVIPEKASKNLVWTNGRQTINYAATGECLPIKQDDGALIGHMFELSYVTDQEDKTDRPVTFLWNGGPGGASMMVNIGGMGPHRVPTHGQHHLPCPSQALDNPYTLLPSSDLVFIDAFGTGYSMIA